MKNFATCCMFWPRIPPAVFILLGLNGYSSAAGSFPQPAQGTVSYQEISFTLPGRKWQKTAEATYTRVSSPGRYTQISAWSIDPYLRQRYWSPEMHTKTYFNFEQHQARPPGTCWGRFAESAREIAGKSYPIMTFEISRDSDKLRHEGTMLLLFPPDFAERQRFYVLMWMDNHPAEESSAGPGELDALVRSISFGSFISPGILMGLTPDAARAESAVPIDDARALARRYARTTGQKRSYQSEYALFDRANLELKPHGFLSMHWALEYMGPDRHHVMQRGWEQQSHGYVYDEWIDLETGHFDNAGVWIKAQDSEFTKIRAELSQALRADRFLALLSSASPASLTECSYLGRRYHGFLFLADSTTSIVTFPITYSSIVDGPYSVRVWVDAATGLLAKGGIVGTKMKADGKPATMEIAQTFAKWDQDFGILAPTVINK